MFLKRMFLGALMAISLTVSAQSPIDALPVKMVNGLSYHYYTVESKETIYSICRKLDISQEELVRLNPSVEDGLKSGQTLYFPMKLNNVTSRVHTVKKKETLYG
ncbi:MAG: LysM peptidoglycan-binding domain-containing protein, partial [Paramuribaculum sp.]|nr:LysM peptidoglycan-binding domain-containing protein [Paramuribaculum sp.]